MNANHLCSIVASAVIGLALLGCTGTPSSSGVARDFVATTTAGDEISGASLLGQVTIVDFWAVY